MFAVILSSISPPMHRTVAQKTSDVIAGGNLVKRDGSTVFPLAQSIDEIWDHYALKMIDVCCTMIDSLSLHISYETINLRIPEQTVSSCRNSLQIERGRKPHTLDSSKPNAARKHLR